MADQNIPVTADADVQIDCDNDNNSTTNVIKFTHNNGTELARIQEDGKVGIGTTNPGEKLEVKDGVLYVNNAGATGYAIIINNNTSIAFKTTSGGNRQLYVGTDDKLTLNIGDFVVSSGNVGIGAASSGEKLEVSGNVKLASGNVFKIGASSGASGTFTSADGKTITVTGGIITSIV